MKTEASLSTPSPLCDCCDWQTHRSTSQQAWLCVQHTHTHTLQFTHIDPPSSSLLSLSADRFRWGSEDWGCFYVSERLGIRYTLTGQRCMISDKPSTHKLTHTHTHRHTHTHTHTHLCCRSVYVKLMSLFPFHFVSAQCMSQLNISCCRPLQD